MTSTKTRIKGKVTCSGRELATFWADTQAELETAVLSLIRGGEVQRIHSRRFDVYRGDGYERVRVSMSISTIKAAKKYIGNGEPGFAAGL